MSKRRGLQAADEGEPEAEGASAAADALPLSACPYQTDDPRRDAWLGSWWYWREWRSFSDGQKARIHGEAIDCCPHDVGNHDDSSLREAWLEGFNHVSVSYSGVRS
jgi:ribosome modulation factor